MTKVAEMISVTIPSDSAHTHTWNYLKMSEVQMYQIMGKKKKGK